MEKSYNPFKMLGSWVGFSLGILSIVSSYVANHVVFLHPFAWAYSLGVQMDWEGMGILAILTMPILFFVYGWIIHAVLRKIGKENPVVVIVLVSMLVILPTVSGLVKDQQTFKAALNSAGVDIHSQNETTAMNAVTISAQAETNASVAINKMLSIANDKSLLIDVRLTALESLAPKVDAMSSDQKKTLSDQLATFDTSGLSDMNKERVAGRITMLQNLLSK